MTDRAIDPMHWGAPAPDVLRGLAQAQAEGASAKADKPAKKSKKENNRITLNTN